MSSIFAIETMTGAARITDIAERLSVKPPSVTRVVKTLSDKGVVHYERYGTITLTRAGRDLARGLLLRRRAMQDFLINVLGVAPLTAAEVAGKVEHDLPADVLCRLVQFVDHYKHDPAAPFQWHSTCDGLCERRYDGHCPAGEIVIPDRG